MSNIGIIIPERAADIGNFMVGRLLPFIEKRSVGHSFSSIIWDLQTKRLSESGCTTASAYWTFYINLLI
jgi:hypothetical protein